MFSRGQKIEILKSSATKRGHPAAGDVGFIENSFLFLKNRFILITGYFYKYGGKYRVPERKKFIVDVGMSKRLKWQIEKGITKEFIKNRECREGVNLAPIAANPGIPGFCVDPTIFGSSGIWHRSTPNGTLDSIILSRLGRPDSALAAAHLKNKSKSKFRPIKIPYGDIKIVEEHNALKNNPYKLSAWVDSMHPLIITLPYTLAMIDAGSDAGSKTGKASLYVLINNILRNAEANYPVKWVKRKTSPVGIKCLKLRSPFDKDSWKNLPTPMVQRLIVDIRFLEVQSNILFRMQQAEMFDQMSRYGQIQTKLHTIRRIVDRYGLKRFIDHYVEKGNEDYAKRFAIFCAFNDLLSIRKKSGREIAYDIILNWPENRDRALGLLSKVKKLQAEAKGNSAALARLFDTISGKLKEEV